MTFSILQIFLLFFFKTSIVISILIVPRYVHGYNEGYSKCSSTFNCGNFTGIGYPFWGNNKPGYCGHPGFKLDCQGEKITIEIMSLKYQILDINLESQLLHIARTDFLQNNICPSSFVNSSLNASLFSYTINDGYATLLYDCDPTAKAHEEPNEFSCPINNHPRGAYFIMPTNFSSNYKPARGCNISLLMPVLAISVQRYMNLSLTVDEVIKEGFEVRWIMEQVQCKNCINSGGKCGYNLSQKEFSCFCRDDEAYAWTCPSPQPPPFSQQHFPATPPADDNGQGIGYLAYIFLGFGKIAT
ncbi:LEAF RUST 10 DISEASE-RESISTANCE LOCUS RECEPTOR-LIKE PROTEIN KINASE-like 2.7 [Pistacia vera]|uniref:LEAF RUST 10 DISEASE-RESISTANCE LOCUS RECEPTOR-LIKE PROTEIN KINASE-like 2.7 n=1 Tax=Pistacia vera TaxID=55513 RepID=UPI0012638807|nr:LEAF RUST 10 DISEASE-RESISTANCE LOCUS RECEPTOR-LIKE PROTEIN KINASE-like 2.7 [Pistacia vera]